MNRFLASYRTIDGRELTQGEVMTALGRLIVGKSTTEERIREWLANISVAALALYSILKETK